MMDYGWQSDSQTLPNMHRTPLKGGLSITNITNTTGSVVKRLPEEPKER